MFQVENVFGLLTEIDINDGKIQQQSWLVAKSK